VGVWDIRLSVLFLCLAPGAWGQFSQQGGKLAGSGGVAAQMGWSVAISADGNTAIAGGPFDQNSTGAVWIFTRTGSAWTQQGPKLAGTAVTGSQLGWSVAISADGNTAIAGGVSDGGGLGAAWVFTRANGAWTQQAKLAGSGAVGSTVQQGSAVALSADGNTALVGGNGDSNNAGALWVFTRSNGVWTQQAKLVGSGATGASGAQLGGSAALSADGNTAASGGIGDGDQLGAVWVFTRTGGAWSQQGAKLTGSGAVGTNGTIVLQGTFVALSADGTLLTVKSRAPAVNGSFDLQTHEPRRAAFDVFDFALRLHKSLLVGAGFIVEIATYVMVALIVIGLLLGWPTLRNTLMGWHAGLAWLALPLVLLTPVTALLMILHLGSPVAPPMARGPAVTARPPDSRARGGPSGAVPALRRRARVAPTSTDARCHGTTARRVHSCAQTRRRGTRRAPRSPRSTSTPRGHEPSAESGPE